MNRQSVSYSTYNPQSFWNVPVSFTSLVGRDQEIAALVDALRQPDVRLLTLLGPGGIGKTRLSLQVAREVRRFFPDGICFVALASITVPELVIPAITEALGIQHVAETPLFEHVAYFLREKRILLILDNFEQVGSAAPLLEELLAACPSLKLIVTSREVLHLQAEREFPVTPLALPPAGAIRESETLTSYSAVALFVQRAQAVLPNFRVTRANAAAIAEVCARLDGLPLAIELAASRVKLLPPEALLKRLAQSFQVLSSDVRTLPARHRTLFNTMKWSYDLLDEQEQWLFRRLSIFVGGWTIEAAESMCAARNDIAVLNRIASLLDKNLLLRLEQEGEEPRLQMLMTLREYGLACLRESGEMEEAQLAHARYYLSLAQEAEPHLKSSSQQTWLARLEQEQENLRAALERLVKSGEAELALRLCGALWRFWFRRGYWDEGRRWLQAALDLPAEHVQPATRARALSAAAELAAYQSDCAEAHLLLEQSIVLYRQLGDLDGLIEPLSRMGALLQDQGDTTGASRCLEESVALARQLGNQWALANVLYRQGHTVWLQNDMALGVMLTEESLAIARQQGDPSLIARILNNLGYMAWQQKDLARAAAFTQENLVLARELDDKLLLNSTLETLGSIALDSGELERAKAYFIESIELAKQLGRKGYAEYCLTLLARVAAAQGQSRQAARLYGAAEREHIAETLLNASEKAEYERNVAAVRAQLDEEAFATAWAEGRAQTVEQALAMLDRETRSEPALAILHYPSGKHTRSKFRYPDELTAREVEVLRLLAQGMTDAQIAECLVISVRTVNNHTTSIYSKIGVSTRSAATRYAVENKLV